MPQLFRKCILLFSILVNRFKISYTILGCLLIFLLWPSRFAKHYSYIPESEIYNNLVPEITQNISFDQMDDCEYEDIIIKNEYMFSNNYLSEIFASQLIRNGGEYIDEDCRPRFSTAIIIPYRNRETQLNKFLIYMHNFLRKQRIHYRIFIVEQYDSKPFNRAKLFNIGAVIAANYEFPCLVLHDVDLMPMNLGNLYACTEKPRHMCSSLADFRYNLPYLGLFGGAVTIRTEQYHFVNGMSNLFEGWGGEDDDFFSRLESKNIDICRFSPDYSKYFMLSHKKEIPNKDRMEYLNSGPKRYNKDGINSLKYNLKEIQIHSLFTHIKVET